MGVARPLAPGPPQQCALSRPSFRAAPQSKTDPQSPDPGDVQKFWWLSAMLGGVAASGAAACVHCRARADQTGGIWVRV